MKTIYLLLLFLVCLGKIQAQDSTNVNQSRMAVNEPSTIDLVVDKYSEKLNLDSKQQNQLRQLLTERNEKIANLPNHASYKRKNDFETPYYARFRRFLNVDQITILNQYLEDKNERVNKFLRINPGFRFSDDDYKLDF
ncbi:hypothetical protein [Marinigracilibium pacificum]|uniref:Uncharacterized protein n=1 Tax=Marinigracilibium pacificum TaxID=2729599 RepID=A0A848IY03_9BACT|nr:hypothetical protein [Marinigracilibium pacificum]NMM47124.1 hypothetical protein [Marinigracilibium pacificum]